MCKGASDGQTRGHDQSAPAGRLVKDRDGQDAEQQQRQDEHMRCARHGIDLDRVDRQTRVLGATQLDRESDVGSGDVVEPLEQVPGAKHARDHERGGECDDDDEEALVRLAVARVARALLVAAVWREAEGAQSVGGAAVTVTVARARARAIAIGSLLLRPAGVAVVAVENVPQPERAPHYRRRKDLQLHRGIGDEQVGNRGQDAAVVEQVPGRLLLLACLADADVEQGGRGDQQGRHVESELEHEEAVEQPAQLAPATGRGQTEREEVRRAEEERQDALDEEALVDLSSFMVSVVSFSLPTCTRREAKKGRCKGTLGDTYIKELRGLGAEEKLARLGA